MPDCGKIQAALLSLSMKRLLILLAMFPLFAVASKVSDSAWHTGTLTDIADEQRTVTSEHEHAYGTHRHSITTDNSYTIPHYIVETDKYVYEAIANGDDRRRRLAVIVNGTLKYAFVGTDLYIQDEQGKEHKMTVLRKTMKTEAKPTEQK